MKFNQDDISALIVTILVHIVAIIIMYIIVISSYIAEEDSGILVNFGDMYTSVGAYEPQYTANPPQMETIPPQPQPKPVSTPKPEKLITQEEEETVSIPDKKKKEEQTSNERTQREREEAEHRQREEEERKRQEEELRRKQEAISNRVSNAFGMGASQQNQQGDATAGTGNQGSPFGNSDTGTNQGTGGFGTFNLDGRYIGQGGLPRPTDRGQEEGKIVINITVDPNGNVILAEIGRGTNIDNAQMRKSAIDAAKRAKFNKIKGANNQNGTITYIYKLT
jgi:TonB family protein